MDWLVYPIRDFLVWMFENTLEPNENGAEESNNNSNFTISSTGFQIGDTHGDFNANGGTYVYMAFKMN